MATDEQLWQVHTNALRGDDGASALRAVYNAGLDRAAEIARTFIPDPHEAHEDCEDCAMIRALAAAIEAEKGQG